MTAHFYTFPFLHTPTHINHQSINGLCIQVRMPRLVVTCPCCRFCVLRARPEGRGEGERRAAAAHVHDFTFPFLLPPQKNHKQAGNNGLNTCVLRGLTRRPSALGQRSDGALPLKLQLQGGIPSRLNQSNQRRTPSQHPSPSRSLLRNSTMINLYETAPPPPSILLLYS